MSLPSKLFSVAEIFSAALVRVFPQTAIVGTSVQDSVFQVVFQAPQTITDDFIPQIEEAMRGILKDDSIEIRFLEMTPASASGRMISQGQPFLAEKIERSLWNIVPILQIGDFLSPYPTGFVWKREELLYFKILSLEKKEGVYIARGVVASDGKKLKTTLKALKAADKELRQLKSTLFSLDVEGLNGYRLTAEGQLQLDAFITWWKEKHRKAGFCVLSPKPLLTRQELERVAELEVFDGPVIEGVPYFLNPGLSLEKKERALELGAAARPRRLEEKRGVLSLPFYTFETVRIPTSVEGLEKELISSLIFIEETYKILNFRCHWDLSVGLAGKKRQILERCASSARRAAEKVGCNFSEEALEEPEEPEEIEESRDSAEMLSLNASVEDSFGRLWDGASLSIELLKPGGLKYAPQGMKDTPQLILNRTVFGSLERWLFILNQHAKGRLTWPLA